MNDEDIKLAAELGESLLQHGWRVGTAESCTGGLLAAAITEVPGSSGWFDEGLVTYANASKQRLLGVTEHDLDTHGAVSREVVEAMVAGVLVRGAHIAVATSGVAGPDGGTAEKPVGSVWIAWGGPAGCRSRFYQFPGDRYAVRQQTVTEALRQLLGYLRDQS